MTQRVPSNAAMPDGAEVSDPPLIVAGRALAVRGHYGLVWVDSDLVVTARYGRLVDFVSVGELLTTDLPALVGLENDIVKLRETDGAVLELPAISMVSEAGETPRLNLLLMWVAEQDCFLCLIMRTGIGSDLEIDLSREIRRRLIAEAEVLATSKALERANRDLEDYASIISHDLQAPMRALRYQIDDLQALLGDQMSQDIVQRMEHIRGQSQRMGKMLSALLEYSSIGRKSDAVSKVDTRSLVTQIISSMEQTSERRVSVTGDWPTLDTLEQPLDLVLRNLIDNAVKYGTAAEANVEIHAQDHGAHVEFQVIDSGPGISVKNRDAIFLPFQTLDRAENAEAKGLGLAIVKRIVSGIGGDVRVEDRSDGKSGAVFHVVWPKTNLD